MTKPSGGRLLLGVDGGATKTIAIVASEEGEVLGAGRTGSSDIHGTAAPAEAAGRVADAVIEALVAAGAATLDLDACVFCLCGADWPEDDAFYAAALVERLGSAEPPLIMNDAFGSLRAGTHDGVGIALVMGTGAAIAARGPTGDTWFSGERLEASGAGELGRWVYERLIRGAYGPGPMPAFERGALGVFGVGSVEELVHEITRVGGPGYQSRARLAPLLLEAGHAGDSSARAYIRAHGEMLAGHVRAAAARVGLPARGATMVLAGGLFRHHCADLVDTIAGGLEGFELVRATVEPVYGAVLMAADVQGVTPDLDRLRDSGPGAAFFETL